MMPVDLSESLRSLHSSEIDLRSRCLHASVARGLFGDAPAVELGGVSFSVLRRLGAGATGVVYEVARADHPDPLALKLLTRAGSEQAYRLKREFRTLSRLGHPNLVCLHELFADASGCAFTMELVHGCHFLPYVCPEGVLQLQRLRDVLAQLAEGLGFLHAHGVIHRDLKPSNLLVDADGRLVLLDFGVALTGPELDVSGTSRFMAPEQRVGRSVPASDLYALGVMLDLALGETIMQPTAATGAVAEPHALPASAEIERLQSLSRRLCSEDPEARPTPSELLGLLRTEPRARWMRPQRSVFVGRRAELAQLTELALGLGHSPRLIYLQGPSGQGKSALLAEFARRYQQCAGSTLVLSGRCCRRESVRYRAFDPLLDALSDALLGSDPALLEALRTEVNGPLLTLFPVLERVPGFSDRRAEANGAVDPRERRAAGVVALRALLARLCSTRPVCFCIDDVHWLDIESLELLRELWQFPEPPGLLWVCAGRPQPDSGFDAFVSSLHDTDAYTVRLEAMAEADARALARTLWPARPQLWARASAASGGNPFMLCQLGQLAQAELLPSDRHAFEHTLERHLSDLPETAGEILSLIALCCQPLSLDALARATGLGHSELDRAVHLLETQSYLRSTPGQPISVEPYHDRIGVAALRLIAQDRQSELHLRLARALDDGAGEQPASSLFWHYRLGGESERALHYGELAAERARERLSFHEAAALLAQCCELATQPSKRSALAAARADVLVSAGRDFEAASIMCELVGAETEHGKRIALRCAAADRLFRAGYLDDAMQLLEPWLRELGLAPQRSRAGQLVSIVVHAARARVSKTFGLSPSPDAQLAEQRVEACLLVSNGLGNRQFLQSLDYASRLRCHAPHATNASQRARAALLEAFLHATLAPTSGRAEAAVELARGFAQHVREPLLDARLSLVAAGVAAMRIDRPAMAHHAERAVQLLEAHGRGVQQELNAARCMWLIAEFGDARMIERELQHVVDDAMQRGDRLSEANARIYLSTALLAAAQPERCRSEAQRAVAVAGASPREAIYWISIAQHARAELFEGAPERAHARLRDALRAMRWYGYLLVPWTRIELRYLCAISAAQAYGARAAREVSAIARALSGESLHWPRLLAEQLHAWELCTRGQHAAALTALESNARRLERDRGAWYAAGSRLLACELADELGSHAGLMQVLRARGLPEPRRFLACYAPLSTAEPS